MRIHLLLFLIICLTYNSSCEKEEGNEKKSIYLPDGVYNGTFKREHSLFYTNTANVTITFSLNTWEGSSNFTHYPALCNGTYSILGDTIIFENACVWTADFQASLILGGKYVLVTKEDSVIIFRNRTYSDTIIYTDKYKLKRQNN